jgi:predicted nucleotidyltransferase
MPEAPLTREQAIERMIASEPEIRALGVQRLALFGSVARGEARVDSDVDLLVEFAPELKTLTVKIGESVVLRKRRGHQDLSRLPERVPVASEGGNEPGLRAPQLSASAHIWSRALPLIK